MNRLGAIAFALVAAGCIRYAVPPLLLARDEAAGDTALRDYRRTLPVPDPYARAIFCLEQSNLRDWGDAGALDAGRDIVCHPPPPPKPPARGTPEALCTESLECSGDLCVCTYRRDAGR